MVKMSDDPRPVFEYSGVVIFDDEPGIPFRLKARDAAEAKRFAKMTYGDHEILLGEGQEIKPLFTDRLKEYKGYVWVGDQPGIRLEIQATRPSEAAALVRETYGDWPMSIWNDEDASRLR